MKSYPKQKGYILLPVVLIITLVSIVVLMMNVESVIETGSSSAEREADEARYVAEAGLKHTLWHVGQAGCGPYTDMTGQAFGDHNYSTVVTPNQIGGTVITITVPVTDDAYIKENTPTQTYGSDAQLQVLNQFGDFRQALYRFDIENAGIPVGATILSAIIKLFVIDPDNSDVVNIYRVNTDWGEDTVTWNSIWDKHDWTVQGSIPQNPTAGEYTTVNITSLVQGWVNGSIANQGIKLVPASWFEVSQYSSKEYGNVDQRPVLEITTTDGSLSTRAHIRATGILANGIEQTLTRQAEILYQPSTNLTWQLGSELKDAFVWDGAHQDVNFGVSPILNIKNDRNVLIQFPMEALPPSSRVVDASLDLYLAGGAGVIDGQLDLHRVSRDWVEGIYDDVNPPPGGGVTYNDYDGSNSWGTSGGDYDAAHIDQVILPTMVPGWYTWHVTDQVQAWLDGQANYGFLLREGGGDAGDIDFVSSDDTATPEYRPRLNITLACECGQACMIPQGSGHILVVVRNPGSLTFGESMMLDLFEAWGYTYSLIQQDDSQGNFDAAAASHDVAFISESVQSNEVDDKLTNFNIGVVNQESALNDELGISTDYDVVVGQNILVTDTTHEITSIFPAGTLQFKQHNTELHIVIGTLAPGAQVLADVGGAATLVVLEQSADMAGGGTAAGRRVMIPLAEDEVNPYLTNNGQLLIQRAIEWAKLPTCGDGDYRDDFQTVAYNNNDGSLLWSSDWVEVDGDGAGPGSGNVRINRDGWDWLSLDDRPDTGGQPSITRTFNLLGADDAMLNFDYELERWTDQGSDVALLEISTDGTNWDVLQDFSLFNGGDWGHRTYNLSDYLVADVQIRFRIESGYGGDDEILWIDKLVVSVCGTLDQPPSIGPIAHWPMDETSGPTAQDIEGGHDGTWTNGPIPVPGQVDGGLQFDGSSDFIDVPHDDTLSLTEAMTFMAWINASTFGTSYQTILAKDTGSGPSNFWFGTWRQELVFGFFDNSWFREVATTGLNLQSGTWYHLAASFDNATDTVRLYVNGIEVHSGTLAFEPTPVTADVTIGRSPDGEYWPGILDDVRIYNRVLGGSEVADLYTEGSNPTIDAEYADQFNENDYDGSDGSLDWSSTSWTEVSDDGTPGTGNIQAQSNLLYLDNQDGGDFEAATRAVDLSIGSPATAVWSFDYGGRGDASSGDAIMTMLSEDGGSTWVGLEKIAMVGLVSGSRSYNLHDYIALTNNAQVGVAIIAGLDGPSEYFYVDNVVIDLDSGGGGGGCDGTYLDSFNAQTFSGDDGSLSWTGDWLEVGESDGPRSGDIGVGPDVSDYQIRVRDNDNGGEGFEREADLSGAGSATLSFSYRRSGLDRGTDFAKVEVSANGAAGPWTEVARFAGPGTDAAYVDHKVDIGAYAAANTRIRFITSDRMGGADIVYFDDIMITCSP